MQPSAQEIIDQCFTQALSQIPSNTPKDKVSQLLNSSDWGVGQRLAQAYNLDNYSNIAVIQLLEHTRCSADQANRSPQPPNRKIPGNSQGHTRNHVYYHRSKGSEGWPAYILNKPLGRDTNTSTLKKIQIQKTVFGEKPLR